MTIKILKNVDLFSADIETREEAQKVYGGTPPAYVDIVYKDGCIIDITREGRAKKADYVRGEKSSPSI